MMQLCLSRLCIKLGRLMLWLCCILASQAHAALVEIPPLQAAVTDLTHTLSAEEQANLNQTLHQFSQQSGSQIAVLLLSTTQPEDIAQFGIRLAQTWQIGRDKQDDGVIIVVAKNDRKMRIEVGYGLEGAIPDVVAKRIISEQLAPAFKQGQFYQGLNQAVISLMKLIQGEQLPAPMPPQQANADWTTWLPMLMFAALFFAAILKSLFGELTGSMLTGGALALLTGWLGATLLVIGLVGLAAFVLALAMGGRGGGIAPYGGFPVGQAGSYRAPDIFTGGGGDFGGGGASGDW